jgi:ABC-type multidrug transport system permease subunit
MPERSAPDTATTERRNPLAALTRARILEFVREPEAIFWVFAFPIIMAVVLGFAFRDRPPDPIPVGVAAGPTAAELTAALAKSGTVKPSEIPVAAEGLQSLRTGKIALLVEEAPGKGLVYRFDPTRPDARLARLEVDEAIQAARGRRDPSPASDERVHEKGSRYIDFLLPGILGLNLMGTGIWGIGFSIVNARLRKTLKLMVATPMRKSDYLLAQMFSRFFFLVLEVGVILVFGVLAFQVPIRGSLGSLAAVIFLGALCFAGIGLLVVSRAKTLEAASGLMNLVMVPMWLLSGVFFSAERFPSSVRPLIRALPLTAVNDALRAIMLEGRGLAGLPVELAVIAFWGLAGFAIALKIFRWQ